MANHRSAAKAARKSARQHMRNKSVKSGVKTYLKKAESSIRADGVDAEAAFHTAVSALDRAAKKGVLHANNAARRKSRLAAKYNAAKSAAG